MRRRRLWSLLLLPGGVAAGHVLGYTCAAAVGSSPSVAGDHSYLTWMFRLGVPFSGGFAALVLFGPLAGPAAAHATLIGTNPADDTLVDRAPEQVELRFDEPHRHPAGHRRPGPGRARRRPPLLLRRHRRRAGRQRRGDDRVGRRHPAPQARRHPITPSHASALCASLSTGGLWALQVTAATATAAEPVTFTLEVPTR